MTTGRSISALASAALAAATGLRAAGVPEEFRVKRQEVFAFSRPPAARRVGDRVEVGFAAKGLCDVTVAVEDGSGRIVRHLVSGVLGENPPGQLRPGRLAQTVVWDGKDDTGRYVDDASRLRIRVSLGLRARLERVLFWSPYKRVGRAGRPLIAPCRDGVAVFEGEGADFLRLFDHQGRYLRTVCPFPARKLPEVRGLKRAVFPQDGPGAAALPLKNGLVQATFLSSGKNVYHGTLAKYQAGATAMAVAGERIALAGERLNRLAIDGTTGGRELEGPETGIRILYAGREYFVSPRSAAFGPDGRTVYFTGYHFRPPYPRPHTWLPCVMKLDFEGGGKLQRFAGSTDIRRAGTQPGEFRAPTSVAVDPSGRVYVADYMNDRVQVFDPEGTFLRPIAVPKPTEIAIHHDSGRLYVASWMLLNRWSQPNDVKTPTLSRFGPFDRPAREARYDLPIVDHNPKVFMNKTAGLPYAFALDSWTDPPTVWLVPAHLGFVSKLMVVRGAQDRAGAAAGIRLLAERNGELDLKRDFGKETVQAVRRARPAIHSRQKLYVDPTDGRLYVFEGQAGVSKSVNDLLVIDPDTGRIDELPLPFDAEDLCFDIRGRLYLRTDNVVGRFRRAKGRWVEVPFDYGEQRKGVGFTSGRGGRRTNLIAALVMPSTRPGCFHQGGMNVNALGHLVVTNYNVAKPAYRKDDMREIREAGAVAAGRAYTPRMFPGRRRWNEVHVWDRHGQVLYEDAAPGVTMMDGIAIDAEDGLYMMIAPNRVLDGQPYFLERAETLVKVRPCRGRMLSGRKDLPVVLEPRPKRPPDARRAPDGDVWIEGAEWTYGGVGFGGFNSSKGGGGCACWHARFALDLFARSFAPEVDHFSVAVLDANGNLMLRIGRYGNADDGRPLIAEGAPADPRSLGGDEVGLMHAAYVAAHTDRRLFIADGGNQRILSVRLDYHATETVALTGLAAARP